MNTGWLVKPLAALGLPRPVGLVALSPDGPHGVFRVELGPDHGDRILRIERDPRRRPSPPVECAALALARPSLPVPDAQPLTGLPWPALLMTLLPGSVAPKSRRLPERMVDVLLALGAIETPGWGDSVVDGHFVPTEVDWSTYWARRVEEATAQIHANGGPAELADALRDAALEGASALRDAPSTLVHGDLVPENLLLDEEGALSGVVDWDHALLGDPLLDWVPALDAPPGVVAKGLAGRTVPALTQSGVVARLQTYSRTRALERLAECGRPWLDGDAGKRRAVLLESAVVLGASHLEPDRVQRWLDAIGGGRPYTMAAPPSAQAVLRRRALETLRHPLNPCALELCAVFAACEVEAALLAEQSSVFLRWASRHRSAWASAPMSSAEWSERVATAGEGAPGLGLALLALGASAIESVDGRVDAGTRRGLLQQVQTSSAPGGWRDAAAGWAGAAVLGVDPGRFRDVLEALPDDGCDPEDFVDGLAFTDWLAEPDAAWVPVLAWALPKLPPEIGRRVAGQLAI